MQVRDSGSPENDKAMFQTNRRAIGGKGDRRIPRRGTTSPLTRSATSYSMIRKNILHHTGKMNRLYIMSSFPALYLASCHTSVLSLTLCQIPVVSFTQITQHYG